MKFAFVIVGMILSGLAAGWGARAAGHDPGAGYPFPDFKGIILLLVGLFAIPFLVTIIAGLVRPIIHTWRISIPVAILTVAPLLGFSTGYAVQTGDNRERNQRREFDASQRKAYPIFAAQVTADPGIVLRERWFEQNPEAKITGTEYARQLVFKHSFLPSHLSVPYTSDQLTEVWEKAPDARVWIVSHPSCPPDLIGRRDLLRLTVPSLPIDE